MAGEQIRTTVSAVFWTADAEAAQAQIDAIAATLPDEDRPNTLSAIEYIAGGKPAPPEPIVPSGDDVE
jgi:hypothetical protein